MPDQLPPEATEAAAIALHDLDCNDGDTQTCGRWNSRPTARFPGLYDGEKHVGYYRDRARAILTVAAPLIAAQAREAADAQWRAANLRTQERMTELTATARTEAALAEREECAKLAEQESDYWGVEIAEKIRARGTS